MPTGAPRHFHRSASLLSAPLRGGPGRGESPCALDDLGARANDGIERSAEHWFRRYNAKAPEKGGAKKSRTMMSREWVKDTREAWEREGQGERIDRRSLAERRDEAERAGDLEQAAELSRKPNVHLGPQAYRAGDLEREGRGERSGVLAAGRPGGAGQSGASAGAGRPSSSGSRRGSRGSIGSFRRSLGPLGTCLVKRSFFETTWRRRWRHEISGLNWRNRPATTVQPEHGRDRNWP